MIRAQYITVIPAFDEEPEETIFGLIEEFEDEKSFQLQVDETDLMDDGARHYLVEVDDNDCIIRRTDKQVSDLNDISCPELH